MQDAKKPRKAAAKTPATARAHAPLPDRHAMESFLAAVGEDLQGTNDRAQEVIYDAWERRTPRSRIALARKALAISPLCADAYVVLAENAAKSPAEARDYFERGVEAGRLALGPEGLQEYAGHFWGVLETRPYMRALSGLAHALVRLGDIDGAIGHFRAMLRLNPNDNQGVRYSLLGCLLGRDDSAAVKELLAEYPEEWSVFWLYTKALIAYREGGPEDKEAAALAAEAWSLNEHVPAILAGTQAPVFSEDEYITEGGADEATYYANECGGVWHRTPGAVAWLAVLVGTLPREPGPSRTIH